MELIEHRFGIDPQIEPNTQALAEGFRIALMIYDALHSKLRVELVPAENS